MKSLLLVLLLARACGNVHTVLINMLDNLVKVAALVMHVKIRHAADLELRRFLDQQWRDIAVAHDGLAQGLDAVVEVHTTEDSLGARLGKEYAPGFVEFVGRPAGLAQQVLGNSVSI